MVCLLVRWGYGLESLEDLFIHISSTKGAITQRVGNSLGIFSIMSFLHVAILSYLIVWWSVDSQISSMESSFLQDKYSKRVSRSCQFLKAQALKMLQCNFCHMLLAKAITEPIYIQWEESYSVSL